MVVEFFKRYFVEPIYTGEGYNVYNTLVYGLLLGFGLIALEKIVIKLNLKVDRRFLKAILPFLAFASFSRSLVDAQLFPRTAWLITPGIFFTTALLALASLALALRMQRSRGIAYEKTMLALGIFLLAYPAYVALTNVTYLLAGAQILALFVVSTAASYALLKLVNQDNAWVFAVFAGHMLDASATIVGVEYYGYFEEHVFEDWLINLIGTAYVLYPLKLIAIGIIIWVINSLIEEENRNFWYFAFFVLGFAPGLRDAFTIMLIG
jgi:uncharacterized membrane protein